jgi:phage FluMu protein Com
VKGKCPKCDKLVMNVYIADVTAQVPFNGKSWNAISYNCPHCQTVLGVQIDPIAIKADIVDELFRKLRG